MFPPRSVNCRSSAISTSLRALAALATSPLSSTTRAASYEGCRGFNLADAFDDSVVVLASVAAVVDPADNLRKRFCSCRVLIDDRGFACPGLSNWTLLIIQRQLAFKISDAIGRLRLLQQKARTTREHIQLVLALRRRREPRPDVFLACADAIEQDVAT